MKRVAWWCVYAGLAYVGFVAGLNTAIELAERTP